MRFATTLSSFAYTYDAVGNRTSETTVGVPATSYSYDIANRLTSVDGVPYSWDSNGNLLSDGVNTLTYNTANRLISATRGSHSFQYAYNGMGDRLRQTADGLTTSYTLDIASGLSQVLGDGSSTYTYGLTRIAQYSGGAAAYFLGDGLDSVRQLANAAGTLTMSRAYEPYGTGYAPMGTGSTSYGFTGEWTDASRLMNLRARYYAPWQGRFITQDTWQGDTKSPMSYNLWLYVNANPINFTDSSGYCSHGGWNDASGIFTEENCDRLESGDLGFTEDWYYSFADLVAQDLPQTAANIRHYLGGSGAKLDLAIDFMRNTIYGWSKVNNEVDKLITWYIRKEMGNCKKCGLTAIEPEIFARGFTPPYIQAWQYWPFNKSQLDIDGSLGSFRVDVEINGTISPERTWLYTRAYTSLSLHLVVLDYYNWHKGLSVSYKGNVIEDSWANSLSEAGLAKEFLVFGDIMINFSELIYGSIFGVSDNPPGEWLKASCIGSQFDIDQEGPGTIDYCGNQMKP